MRERVKPRLLDLFCGAGGCSVGYARAGFEVVGVDVKPQPNYPFAFIQRDALDFLMHGGPRPWASLGWDAIHASPPCQNDTAYNRRPGHVRPVPELIGPTRELLRQTDLPYVIENVPGAPLRDPIQLCGSSFGLDVRRHRLFESNVPILAPPCDHSWQTPRFPAATNRKPNSRCTVEIGVYRIPLAIQKAAMGVDWEVTLPELSQAIPPAYTEHIGGYLLNAAGPPGDQLPPVAGRPASHGDAPDPKADSGSGPKLKVCSTCGGALLGRVCVNGHNAYPAREIEVYVPPHKCCRGCTDPLHKTPLASTRSHAFSSPTEEADDA